MIATSLKSALPVWVLSLGCPKNRVDTERTLGSLGMPVKICRYIGKSRLVFINTCAFIEPASRESIRAILDALERVGKLRHKPLVAIAGCLVGRYGIEELQKELPDVDLWLSTETIDQWPDIIANALNRPKATREGRILQENLPYAWLKIGDGCRHKCSFCAIPSIKGALRSEPEAKIMAEARSLIARGVKELVLVAQDVSAWGMDLIDKEYSLPVLVEQLAGLPGLKWLRMLYLYPSSINDRLLHTIADIGLPVLPYLDIPMQHSEPQILASMCRSSSVNPRHVLDNIRRILPEAALRTTLITGYPGETQKQFENLCSFVEDAGFHNLGVFTYQAEEGTRAATLPNQIPPQVKEDRRNILMEIQAQVSRRILQGYVGEKMHVLVDGAIHDQWPGLHCGRVWFQAPEIDGITYVSGPGVEPGAFVECDIEESHIYDLTALA